MASLFLRGRGEEWAVPLLTDRSAEKRSEKEQKLLCSLCRLVITDTSQAMEVNGLHGHAFFNPAGLVFEIACFADAVGCRQEGVPSSHFSWFAGTTWQVAVCRSCDSHLGWFFQGRGMSFFALIRNRLLNE
ncbi:MAG: hypothetical protein KJ804_09955 [Proteobacteria bacterium]|nr:hypothetical protein [Pseudomonadota bacterium]MBU1058625.1 hypothetical protein [Pseudomonadota bacterium]